MDYDFDEHHSLMNQDGSWCFIVPVSGVILTNDVKKEFQIQRVLLVEGEKIPKVRKRLGLPRKISELHPRYKDFFDGSKVFAVIRHTGKLDETKRICRKLISEELAILSASQLGYMKRRFGSRPAIQGTFRVGNVSDAVINSKDSRSVLEERLSGKMDDIVISSHWKNYHHSAFFERLLKILNKKIRVDSGWRDDLRRATVLIGQSQASSDLAQSFLWNMISLEILLTRQGDKYTDAIPARLEAFLGWVGFWNQKNYPAKIEEIYKKRNSFVHDGNSQAITVDDVLFTDDLLLNLLTNIVHHINLFTSKESIVVFAEKVKAERLLKITPKVRPKTLRFFSRTYTSQDLFDI
jgi:hypothetical protein